MAPTNRLRRNNLLAEAVPIRLAAGLDGNSGSETISNLFSAGLVYNGGTPLETIADPFYLPLTVDPGLPTMEIVWLTGYALGGLDGTLLRGQEGTVAQQHAPNCLVRHAPTTFDLSVSSANGDPWFDIASSPFWADTTGVHDSTTAFNAAIAAATALPNGGVVLVSSGTYLINSNVTVPANVALMFTGGILKPNSGATITYNQANFITPDVRILDLSLGGAVVGPMVGEWNVRWFGAQGIGGDDASSLQQAANAALASGRNANVLLGAGTFGQSVGITGGAANTGISFIGIRDTPLQQGGATPVCVLRALSGFTGAQLRLGGYGAAIGIAFQNFGSATNGIHFDLTSNETHSSGCSFIATGPSGWSDAAVWYEAFDYSSIDGFVFESAPALRFSGGTQLQATDFVVTNTLFDCPVGNGTAAVTATVNCNMITFGVGCTFNAENNCPTFWDNTATTQTIYNLNFTHMEFDNNTTGTGKPSVIRAKNIKALELNATNIHQYSNLGDHWCRVWNSNVVIEGVTGNSNGGGSLIAGDRTSVIHPIGPFFFTASNTSGIFKGTQRTVTDGIVNGTAAIASTAAAFTTLDVGSYVSGSADLPVTRTDACGATGGQAIITDSAILVTDVGRPVSGPGVTTLGYVGTIVPGVSFRLSSSATSQVDLNFVGASLSTLSISRSDVCGTTSGSPTVTDISILTADQGRSVSGSGVPAASFVGTVTPGVSFLLSASPTTQINVNAMATASPTLTITRIDTSGKPVIGNPVVADVAILSVDQGRSVTGAGIPASSFIGTVIPGVSFRLSSDPNSQIDVNAGAVVAVGLTLDGATITSVVKTTVNSLSIASNLATLATTTAHGLNVNDVFNVSGLTHRAAFVGTVTPGVSYQLSSSSVSQINLNATATATAVLSIARLDVGCGTTISSPVVSDAAILAADQGRTVTGAGVPASSFVGTVIPGVSFRLSSSPTSQVDVNATITGSPTVTISRSDTSGTTTGSSTITDSTITAGDLGRGVSGSGIPSLNGSFIATAVTSTTISYAATSADLSSVADSGTVTAVTLSTPTTGTDIGQSFTIVPGGQSGNYLAATPGAEAVGFVKIHLERINLAAMAIFVVNVTTSDPFEIVIAMPTDSGGFNGEPTLGQQFRVMVKNNSGGAMGAINWLNTVFALKSPFVNPVSGAWTTIEFVWDGAFATELTRST